MILPIQHWCVRNTWLIFPASYATQVALMLKINMSMSIMSPASPKSNERLCSTQKKPRLSVLVSGELAGCSLTSKHHMCQFWKQHSTQSLLASVKCEVMLKTNSDLVICILLDCWNDFLQKNCVLHVHINIDWLSLPCTSSVIFWRLLCLYLFDKRPNANLAFESAVSFSIKVRTCYHSKGTWLWGYTICVWNSVPLGLLPWQDNTYLSATSVQGYAGIYYRF